MEAKTVQSVLEQSQDRHSKGTLTGCFEAIESFSQKLIKPGDLIVRVRETANPVQKYLDPLTWFHERFFLEKIISGSGWQVQRYSFGSKV